MVSWFIVNRAKIAEGKQTVERQVGAGYYLSGREVITGSYLPTTISNLYSRRI